MQSIHDTIAAIATPIGMGAIGIVRLSGADSLSITTGLIRPQNKALSPYRLSRRWITDRHGTLLDEVLISYMPGPGSYTGEDVTEINCHGNPAILEAVVEAAVASGARQADPGEFTKRAFLNGKMDLTQAEAVFEMINAPTEAGIHLARNKLQGLLSRKIGELRSRLARLKQQLCLAVDFPEEDIECLPREDLARESALCYREIASLISGYDKGRVWTQGVLVVLAGQVNAGKSSLMNAIIGRERAIVADMPGTTRDYLEEAVNLSGLPVRLIDTAGLRQAQDYIEQQGLNRGRELMRCADILVLVLDSTREPSAYDQEILQAAEPEYLVIALNKWDLIADVPHWALQLKKQYQTVCSISSKYGTGLENFTESIRNAALQGKPARLDNAIIPNLRQKACLEKACAELKALEQETMDKFPYDLLAVRLDYVCSELDQVTGKITPDQTLHSIFDNFCIGK